MTSVLYLEDEFINSVDEPFLSEKNMVSSVCNTVVMKKKAPEGVFLYRGWMMSDSEYADLYKKLSGNMIVSPQSHEYSHYIDGWYPDIQDVTFETTLFQKDDYDGIETFINNSSKTKFFIKDYVKSLTNSRGSIASSLKDVFNIMHQLETYHGIQKGIAIRNFHNLDTDSEQRHFVYDGHIFSNGEVSLSSEIIDAVKKLSAKSIFFAVDTVFDKDGRQWVVEVGDGQMSEFKNWSESNILNLFSKIT